MKKIAIAMILWSAAYPAGAQSINLFSDTFDDALNNINGTPNTSVSGTFAQTNANNYTGRGSGASFNETGGNGIVAGNSGMLIVNWNFATNPTVQSSKSITIKLTDIAPGGSWMALNIMPAIPASGSIFVNQNSTALGMLFTPSGGTDAFVYTNGAGSPLGWTDNDITLKLTNITGLGTASCSFNYEYFSGATSIYTGTFTGNLPGLYLGIEARGTGTSTVSKLEVTTEGPFTGFNEWNADAAGNFSTPGNWTLGAPAADSNVLFGSVITADRTVTLDTSAQLNHIGFNNSGDGDYFITPAASQTITLTGSAAITTFGRHWLRAPLAGTAGVNLAGGGELVLDAVNTFTGGLTINDTNVAVVRNGALSSGQVNVTNNAELRLWGPDNGLFTGAGSPGFSGTFANAVSVDATSRIEINDGADATLAGVVSGAGGVRVNNSDVTFAAANAFTGAATFVSGNASFSGAGSIASATQINIGNGDAVLQVSDSAQVEGAALLNFTSDGGAVGSTARMELDGGVTLSNPSTIAQRSGTAPAIVNTGGSNTLSGDIALTVGGASARIQSDAGLLTLAGTISTTATTTRSLYLQGAGNGEVTDPVSSITGNIAVTKAGTGTWTLPSTTSYGGNTTVEEGTFVLLSDGFDIGALTSPLVSVRSPGTFDVSDFGTYELGIGQSISGGGTIVANDILAYGDNNIAPGDSVGTLTINGSLEIDDAGSDGILEFELGDTTAIGGTENDLIQISGALTTSGSPAMTLRVIAAEGSLATGTYRLINHSGGVTNWPDLTIELVDTNGMPLVVRQSLAVDGSTAGQVNLVVTGNPFSLTWAGAPSNNTWDVTSSTNWNGPGGATGFFAQDLVTFGAAGEKNVVIAGSVAPSSTTFDSASTYTFSGGGGITGAGPVDIDAGTVVFGNLGNNHTGTTTIASGARMETVSASVGPVVANGQLSVIGTTSSVLVDDFDTPGLGEYTFAKVLDQGSGGTNLQFDDSSGALSVTSVGSTGAEQVLFYRGDHTLEPGEELRIDGPPTFNKLETNNYGIALTSSAASLGNPEAGDIRGPEDYLFISWRGQIGQMSASSFAGTLTGDNQAFGVNATQLFIKRTGAGSVEYGYYDGAARIVMGVINGNNAATFNNIGFYADLRSDLMTISGLDNLRIVTGDTSSTLAINGDLNVASTGALEFDLTSAGAHTSVAATGNVQFASGSTVSVELLGGYSPAEGASFQIVSAASITDNGVVLSLPALAEGLVWDTSDFLTTGTIAVTTTTPSTFAAWIASYGLTDADLDDDLGGLDNAIEWVVGGDPTEGSDDAGLAPTFDNTSDPDFFIFNHRRTDLANADGSTSIGVEYGSDLAGWTTAMAGPDVVITEFDDDYAAGVDRVEVKIRRTLAVDGRVFVRLFAEVAE